MWCGELVGWWTNGSEKQVRKRVVSVCGVVWRTIVLKLAGDKLYAKCMFCLSEDPDPGSGFGLEMRDDSIFFDEVFRFVSHILQLLLKSSH